MITAFFKIYLDDISQPFELILKDETTFTFNYGLGKEQWGFHNLKFRVKFSTVNKNNINRMIKYAENIYPYLKGYNNIKEIVFDFIDDNDIKEHFSFKKGEFSNFNMAHIIESNRNGNFTIAFNIEKGES